MAQINQYENVPVFGGVAFVAAAVSNNLLLQGFVLNDSISFNIPTLLISAVAATTLTFSMGLYSLNGDSLSLANSASGAPVFGAAGISYITLATSTTQNLTPGNWYWGVLCPQNANQTNGQYNARTANQAVYGGIVVDG